LFFGFYFVSSIFSYSFVCESFWRWCWCSASVALLLTAAVARVRDLLPSLVTTDSFRVYFFSFWRLFLWFVIACIARITVDDDVFCCCCCCSSS
jgi:hypothetical protein